MISKQQLSTICRNITGLLWILSGVAKAMDAAGFAKLIASYGFPSLAWCAPLIIFAEVALGLALLFRIYTRPASIVSVILLIVFTVAYSYALLFNEITDCGCFGKIKFMQMPVGLNYARNILMVAMAGMVWRYDRERQDSYLLKKAVVPLAILLGCCFVAGHTYQKVNKRPERHPMFERAVRETALPGFAQLSPDSTYMVFIFSYRCQNCWNHFENIKSYHFAQAADRIIVLAGGNDSDNVFKNYFKPEFPITEVDERELRQLTRTSPTLFYIEKDTIRYVIEGSIPTYYLFRKNYLELDYEL